MAVRDMLKLKDLDRCLRKLQDKHNRLIARTQKEMERSKLSYKDITRKTDEMVAIRNHECEQIELDISLLWTKILCRKADKCFLPMPRWNDEEIWEDNYGCKYLSTKGIYTIRQMIRTWQKEERDRYLPWICVFTGLIGTLIGLVSLLIRK